MKKKIIMALATGAMVAAMAMPTGVFADNTTDVGVVPQAAQVDPPGDGSVIVTIPADSWFANASTTAVINDFDLQAKVLGSDNTYHDVGAYITGDSGPKYELPADTLPNGIAATADSGATTSWTLTGGTKGHTIGYKITMDGSDISGDGAQAIGTMTNDDSRIEGSAAITNVDQLTADDAGQTFKDTITFGFSAAN